MNVMRFLTAGLVSISLIFCLRTEASAIPVLDQQSLSTVVSFYKADNLTWQQGVTAGETGTLAQIDIWFLTSEVVDIAIFSGTPWQYGSPIYSTSLTPIVGDWNSIDISSANFSIVSGDQFTIQLHGSDPNTRMFGGSRGEYSGGVLWVRDTNFLPEAPLSDGNYDMAFRTYVEPSSVPEPSTLLLLGSGLVGLVGLNRRRKA